MAFQKKYDLIYSDLSYQINGCSYKVHKELGGGHLESVYQKAMALALKNAKLAFVEQKNLPVVFLNSKITDYRPDFIVEDKIVIDLKRHKRLLDDDFNQVFRYLQLKEYKLGILYHFGREIVNLRRVANIY